MSENKKSAGFWALLLKGGTLLLKSAKLLKIAFAAATFASYAYLLNWKFALMVLVAIGFHESGHVWAMKKMGMKTKGFYFIPFLGGAAIASEPHKSHADQAFVAIMGPIWGFVLALATYLVFLVTGNPLFAAVASWMALVNLFNLLPVNPLDGGQITRTITFSVNSGLGLFFLGTSIIASVALAFYCHIGLFAVLGIAAVLDFVGEVFAKRRLKELVTHLNDLKKDFDYEWIDRELVDLKDKMPVMSDKQIAITGVSYLTLIVLLFTVMYKTSHIPGADIALLLLKD